MRNRYFMVTMEERVDVIKSGMELINQDYYQLPESTESNNVSLFIDTGNREFFFTDQKGMRVAKNIVESDDEKIIETNLKEIKQWPQLLRKNKM